MENVFERGGIRLRPMEPDDADFFYTVENDSGEWGTSLFFTPRSLYFLKAYVQNSSNDIYEDKQLRMVIERSSDAERLGIIDLFDFNLVCSRAEVGVFILKEFRSNGYAVTALRILADYAFTYLRLMQLYAFVNAGNDAAVRLFESAGFDETATLKKWFSFKGEYFDAKVFQLLG